MKWNALFQWDKWYKAMFQFRTVLEDLFYWPWEKTEASFYSSKYLLINIWNVCLYKVVQLVFA